MEEITILSYFEYQKLLDGLKPYEEIKELKPLAEAMKRTLDKLTIYA